MMKEQNDKSKDFVNREFKKAGFNHFVPDEKLRREIDPRTPNFHDLKKQMVDLGFGEVFAESLWLEMQKGVPKITFPYRTLIDEHVVGCELQFSKMANGNYFFNQYRIDVSGITDDLGNFAHRSQTIPVEYYDTANKSCSVQEAYNLLNGRWVFKDVAYPDGLYYKDWMRYDPSTVTLSGNSRIELLGKNRSFDLDGAIKELPIVKFGQHNCFEEFKRSLEQGNKEEATILTSAGEKIGFKIIVSPDANTLDVYQKNGRVYISNKGDVSTLSDLKSSSLERKNRRLEYKNTSPHQKEKKRKRFKR
jgi:hypothetical protein